MDVAYKLDCEWPHLASGKVAEVFPHWQQQQPQLRRFRSPHTLLAFLHSAPAEQTDAPLLGLLALARHERLAGRTLVQVLLPALKTRAERIVHPRHLRDEVWELLLYSAWEAICCYPLERRRLRVAANLVLQVVHRTTRELHRPLLADNETGEQTPGWLRLDPDDDGRADRDPGLDEPLAPTSSLPAEAVVLAGVAAGVITAEDADLILLTRVDGIRLALVARTQGIGYHALRQRRQRAERQLRALLGGADVSKRPDLDPVLYAGPLLLHRHARDIAAGSEPPVSRAA